MAKVEEDTKPVGCVRFFISVTVLVLLALIQLYALPSTWSGNSVQRIVYFAIGILPGIFIATHFITGKRSVFLHETKHALLSGFVGNKWKSMEVENAEGAFVFTYTKKTAVYVGFIMLAPYYLPLMTILTVLGTLPFDKNIALVFVGIGFAVDTVTNSRDIGRHQTDFSNIRGGFLVGMIFVIAMNITLTCYLLAWVLGGVDGLGQLFQTQLAAGEALIGHYF